jgi:Sulfotransferase domain
VTERTERFRTRSRRAVRLPDFIIVGAAKSGTTSLFTWLTAQPDIWSPHVKEPDFFSHEQVWRRGMDWYGRMFAGAGTDRLCGEASTSYTKLGFSATAAERIAATIPDVRIVYVVRHPIERLRSHYRHEIQRGREHRPLAEALADPQNEYAGTSSYFARLEPYTRLLDRSQIRVVRFEDLIAPAGTGWSAIIEHLGLPDRPRPDGVYNVTADKLGFTRTMDRLWKLGLLRPAKYFPRPVRRLGKRVLMRSGSEYIAELDRSLAQIPEDVERRIWDDVGRLERWLGVDEQLWPEIGAPQGSADGRAGGP